MGRKPKAPGVTAADAAAVASAGATPPAKGLRVWAQRPIQYAGLNLDRGQIHKLQGAKNDEKLLRLGYLAEWKPGIHGRHACRYCGGEFVDLRMLNSHGDKTHTARAAELSPMEEDELASREEKTLQQTAPLNLDKTAATLGG